MISILESSIYGWGTFILGALSHIEFTMEIYPKIKQNVRKIIFNIYFLQKVKNNQQKCEGE